MTQKRREHIVKKEKKKAKTKTGAMRGKRAGKLSRHGSPWRLETCKKGCGDLQNAKEGEHLPNCGDDNS